MLLRHTTKALRPPATSTSAAVALSSFRRSEIKAVRSGDQTEPIIAALRMAADVHLRAAQMCADDISRAADVVASALAGGHKLLVFGNGGSAASAQHIAAEFVGRFVHERRPLPALALAGDASTLTAIGNDYGFEQVFARQVTALGQPGDVALAITTSGSSPNVLQATAAARQAGLIPIGLTGESGEDLRRQTDVCIVVPSSETARIQECHLAIGHIICECIERRLSAGNRRLNSAKV